jgi:hypothetical protein
MPLNAGSVTPLKAIETSVGGPVTVPSIWGTVLLGQAWAKAAPTGAISMGTASMSIDVLRMGNSVEA